MILKTFRHLWGITEPLEEVFPRIRQEGYDGIEFKGIRAAAYPDFQQLLDDYQFLFIAQIHTYGETVEEHFNSFRELIETSMRFNPVLINSQSGKDSWSFDEKAAFMELALEYEKQSEITVAHEIHRSRITYNPWDTRDLLLRFSDMKICCDFSHWVCVCERLIDTEIDIVRLCTRHCIHLHSRVGYEQGPQVSDPRAPEYASHLEAHERWWDIIWQHQSEKGETISTLTPEFGPPEYQHTLPFSRQPVSDTWEICNWMHQRQRQRFNQLINNVQNVTVNRSY